MLAIIGLALIASFQDILKDVIAGLVLPFQKHLEVGCKIGGTNYWGEITRIGLRDIEIKKPDGRKALLPISVIMKEPLMEIYCEKENCPITLDFYFNIHTDIEKCQLCGECLDVCLAGAREVIGEESRHSWCKSQNPNVQLQNQ